MKLFSYPLYFSFEFEHSLVQLKFTLHTYTQIEQTHTQEKYSKKGLSSAFELSSLFLFASGKVRLLPVTLQWSLIDTH